MRPLLLRTFIALCLVAALARCANIRTPSGGPKDKKPPRLISSIPPANQTNYKGTTILLTFDETVKLNNPREEIIISPSPGKEIEYQVKNNKVFITPKTPWKDSTTYSILFREGIQDITESNVPPNLKLAFSTGPHIDSLIIAGTVTDLLLGDPKDQATVAIYASDTFNIFLHAPEYFTKTDKNGNFQLENIANGTFRLYAFVDKNKNLKIESRSEMFGFLKQPLELHHDVDTLQIGLVQLDSRPLKLSSVRNLGNLTRIKYSKALTDFTITPDTLSSAFGDNQTEINIWAPLQDSLRVHLMGRDSLETTTDTLLYIKRDPSVKVPQEKFSVSLGGPSINPDQGRLITTLTFSKPILQFNYDSLYIKVDTTARLTFSKDEVTYIRKKKQLRIQKDLGKKMFGPDSNPELTLMMKKAFALSMDQDTSKAQSETVTIYWPEENAIVSVQAQTSRKNYILQLIEKTSRKVVAEAINQPRLNAKNVVPSDYLIRAILDDNANGKWDPGNYERGIEPEKIIYYRAGGGSKIFPVRANWEIGPLSFTF